MKYIQHISPIAHQDIKEIFEYILTDSKTSAKNQAEMIYNAINRLLEFPFSGGELNKKIKRKTDYRYFIAAPYIIFYKIEKEFIKIYRVLDGRQDYIKVLEL